MTLKLNSIYGIIFFYVHNVWGVICCLMHIACISIVSCQLYFLIHKVLNSCGNLRIKNLNACFENGNISILTNSIYIYV